MPRVVVLCSVARARPARRLTSHLRIPASRNQRASPFRHVVNLHRGRTSCAAARSPAHHSHHPLASPAWVRALASVLSASDTTSLIAQGHGTRRTPRVHRGLRGGSSASSAARSLSATRLAALISHVPAFLPSFAARQALPSPSIPRWFRCPRPAAWDRDRRRRRPSFLALSDSD